MHLYIIYIIFIDERDMNLYVKSIYSCLRLRAGFAAAKYAIVLECFTVAQGSQDVSA